MAPMDAIIGQYNKTILDLQARLANCAAELAQALERCENGDKELDSAKKELAELKKEPVA